MGHGFNYQLAYTWAHAIDNASLSGSYGVDDTNFNRWIGNSDFNRSQSLQASYIYDLPFFKNNPNRFVKNGLGGWQFSGITSFYSGYRWTSIAEERAWRAASDRACAATRLAH